MNRRELYWYCPDVVGSASGMTSKASLLSPLRLDDLEDPDFNFSAVLVSCHSVEPIQCRVATLNEFASGRDENDMPVTLFNGEVRRSSVEEAVISIAQNQVVLHIEGGTPTQGRPALISTDGNVSYFCSLVVIQLFCPTIAELPDFAAGLESTRMLEARLSEGWGPLPPLTFSDELEFHAKSTPLGSGHILPVTYNDGDCDRIGALILNHEISSSPLHFSANLYLFHKPARLEPGTLLSRRVTWTEGPQLGERSAQVARIVSILEMT